MADDLYKKKYWMKTYKNLYPQICAFENLYRSYRRARRGKRDRQAVADFEFDLHARVESST
jgi:hypothetical protein